MGEKRDIRDTRGLVATINLTGLVDSHFMENWSHLRSWNDRNGFHNVEYRAFHAVLVESGRDGACMHAVENGYDWLLMIDGDAAPFPQDALARLLTRGFVEHPDLDVVGAYSQQKGSHLPTIDTGTGTWEPHFPQKGIVPVIRTGAHFLLVKRSALQRFGPPWFRAYEPQSPARALREVDGFSRRVLDGRNPLAANPEWDMLVAEASRRGGDTGGSVGEDSGFCDRLRAKGGTIAVDTDIVAGHVAKKVITPEDLKEKVEERERRKRLAVGVLG